MAQDRPAAESAGDVADFENGSHGEQFSWYMDGGKVAVAANGNFLGRRQERIGSPPRPSALLGLPPQAGSGHGGLHGLAVAERSETAAYLMVKLSQLCGAGLIVFFQKAKSFADNLASRVVASGFDLGADELFELGGERNVHGVCSWWLPCR